MNSQEKKLTVVEASKICGVTRTTVWRWIKTGELNAALTAGGHHRINESVLAKFMDKKKMLSSRRGNDIKSILIVDDDLSIHKFFNRLFSKREFQLYSASDGFEAGMKTIKYKPNLVILDLFMPKMDGFKVCQQIRKEPETNQTKIIAISGYDTKDNRKKILDLGADAFCAKPIDSKKVLSMIDRLLK